MIAVLILFLSVVFASGLCSMTEAAFLSLPLVRARILYEEKRVNSAALLYIKENISQVIAFIVVFNNAVNIFGSIFIGQMVASKFGDQWLGLASAVLTFAIIIASEIIPKTLGERYKVPLSLFFAKPVKFLLYVFRPLIDFLNYLTHPITGASSKVPKVTEDEIKMMLKLGRAEGTVELDEELLCSRVFKLNDVYAAQIMKPIEQAFALPVNQTLEELRDAILNSPYSRILAYDQDPKNIVGIIQHKSILREIARGNIKKDLSEFTAKPIFVNWFTKADQLLEKFIAYRQHLFIVQDTQGRDIGIVTMEDVLEELFGEIYDEDDIVESEINQEEVVEKKSESKSKSKARSKRKLKS